MLSPLRGIIGAAFLCLLAAEQVTGQGLDGWTGVTPVIPPAPLCDLIDEVLSEGCFGIERMDDALIIEQYKHNGLVKEGCSQVRDGRRNLGEVDPDTGCIYFDKSIFDLSQAIPTRPKLVVVHEGLHARQRERGDYRRPFPLDPDTGGALVVGDDFLAMEIRRRMLDLIRAINIGKTELEAELADLEALFAGRIPGADRAALKLKSFLASIQVYHSLCVVISDLEDTIAIVEINLEDPDPNSLADLELIKNWLEEMKQCKEDIYELYHRRFGELCI